MEPAWCGCALHGTQCKRRCSRAHPENERVNASRSSAECVKLFRGGYQKRERLVRSLGVFEAIYRRIAMLRTPRQLRIAERGVSARCHHAAHQQPERQQQAHAQHQFHA